MSILPDGESPLSSFLGACEAVHAVESALRAVAALSEGSGSALPHSDALAEPLEQLAHLLRILADKLCAALEALSKVPLPLSADTGAPDTPGTGYTNGVIAHTALPWDAEEGE